MAEFEIKSLPNVKFRVKRVNPIDLLAMSMSMDLGDFKSNKTLVSFALENIETQLGDKWFPVSNRGVLTPTALESNLIAMSELTEYFVSNVLFPVFPNASE